MDYKEITDRLFNRVGHEDFATRLGVSLSTVRQARLREDANAWRCPPKNWEAIALQISDEREAYYRDLSVRLRGGPDQKPVVKSAYLTPEHLAQKRAADPLVQAALAMQARARA